MPGLDANNETYPGGVGKRLGVKDAAKIVWGFAQKNKRNPIGD
jgi:hypothetical protein